MHWGDNLRELCTEWKYVTQQARIINSLVFDLNRHQHFGDDEDLASYCNVVLNKLAVFDERLEATLTRTRDHVRQCQRDAEDLLRLRPRILH